MWRSKTLKRADRGCRAAPRALARSPVPWTGGRYVCGGVYHAARSGELLCPGETGGGCGRGRGKQGEESGACFWGTFTASRRGPARLWLPGCRTLSRLRLAAAFLPARGSRRGRREAVLFCRVPLGGSQTSCGHASLPHPGRQLPSGGGMKGRTPRPTARRGSGQGRPLLSGGISQIQPFHRVSLCPGEAMVPPCPACLTQDNRGARSHLPGPGRLRPAWAARRSRLSVGCVLLPCLNTPPPPCGEAREAQGRRPIPFFLPHRRRLRREAVPAGHSPRSRGL